MLCSVNFRIDLAAASTRNESNCGNCGTVSYADEACSVNAFKARLDKIWSHQDVKFDFTTSLTGIGNRSEHI